MVLKGYPSLIVGQCTERSFFRIEAAKLRTLFACMEIVQDGHLFSSNLERCESMSLEV